MSTFGNIDIRPLKSHGLSQCRGGVLSGSIQDTYVVVAAVFTLSKALCFWDAIIKVLYEADFD